MVLHQSTHAERAGSYQSLLWVLVIIAAAVALLLVLTVILGVPGTGPSLELVPDPAGVSLPF
jgi:hypothetical protein